MCLGCRPPVRLAVQAVGAEATLSETPLSETPLSETPPSALIPAACGAAQLASSLQWYLTHLFRDGPTVPWTASSGWLS